jgi:hypothetical protein
VHKEDDDYRQLLQDELKDKSIIKEIHNLANLRVDKDETLGGPYKLFHLVYRDIPHRMKTKLRSVDNKDLTMTQYFEQFPVTLEALILMMFETIPDYLKGMKFNTNKAIQEDRHTSIASNDSNVTSENEKKKGGQPADKAGFVLPIFEKYKEEVWKRREFNFPPDENQYGDSECQKVEYRIDNDEWVRKKSNMEFAFDEDFYQTALDAINDKNRESRKSVFTNLSSLANIAGSYSQDTANINSSSITVSNHNKRAEKRYDNQRCKKLKSFDPHRVRLNEIEDMTKQFTSV